MFQRMKKKSGHRPVTWIADAASIHRFGPLLAPVARSLITSGPGLCIVCDEQTDLSDLPSEGITVVRYRHRPFWVSARRWRAGLTEDLRPHDPLLLHALAESAMPLAVGLAETLGVPCIAACYDLEIPEAPGPRSGRGAKALIAASQPVSRALTGRGESHVHLIRPGLATVDEALCLQHPDRAISVVICGALSRVGPFQAVLETVAQLRSDGMDCELFLVGSGPAERPLRKAAAALGMTGWLTFAGEQPLRYLAKVFEDADVYIAPRRHTRVGIRTLVAMSTGAAVLCADQPASDFVIPGKTATVFSEGQPADLAAKLRAMLKDPSAPRDQALRALEHLREHHRVESMFMQVADAYEDLLV